MTRSNYWMGIGLLTLLASIGAGCRFFSTSLQFSVIVEEPQGLEANRPVMFRGEQVGRVVSVTEKSEGETRIEVEVAREFRGEVCREDSFQVWQCEDGLPCLLIETRPGDRTPVQDGDQLDVRPGWLERLSRNLKQLGESAGETMERLKADVETAVSDLKDSPEAQALKEGLVEFGQDVAKMARGRIRHFVAAELPKLEERAKAYREKLEEEGRREDAEIFWKWFTRWADGMRQAAGEMKPEAEPESRQ